MTKQQQIMDAIDAVLNNISIANGYSFDISGRVKEWPVLQSVKDWTISYFDNSSEISEDESNGYFKHLLQLDIVLEGAAGLATLSSLREKMQDVLTALKSLRDDYPEYVDSVNYIGHEKIVEQEQYRLAGAKMAFNIGYSTDYFKI
jgi:hypothetical protein